MRIVINPFPVVERLPVVVERRAGTTEIPEPG
jgi:hypothetical protein